MIELYLGPPGGGKSYHALRRGLAQLSDRRYVVSNFPLALSKKEKDRDFEAKHWHFVEDIPSPDYLIRKSIEWECVGKEGRILLIIDEAGILFNSRDWMVAGEVRKQWIKFFSQSRKFGYDVILVAQDERMLDRQIRSCAEFRVKHFTLNQYTFLRWLPVKTFVAVRFWAGGSFRGQPEVFILLPWIANRYDSMRLFGEFADEVEEKLGHGQRGSDSGVPLSVSQVTKLD